MNTRLALIQRNGHVRRFTLLGVPLVVGAAVGIGVWTAGSDGLIAGVMGLAVGLGVAAFMSLAVSRFPWLDPELDKSNVEHASRIIEAERARTRLQSRVLGVVARLSWILLGVGIAAGVREPSEFLAEVWIPAALGALVTPAWLRARRKLHGE